MKPEYSRVGSDPAAGQQRVEHPASLIRRRLLKAAASSAPLIATLPSGAAMAQASVANCLVKVGNEAAAGRPDGFVAASAADEYLRVAGAEIVYVNSFPPNQTLTFYRFSIAGNTIEVDADGNWLEFPDGSLFQQQSATAVRLLVLYRGLDANPLTQVAENCNLAPQGTGWPSNIPTPTSPEYCVWPLAKVESAQPGNLGMPLSCWCSLNPGDTNICG